MLGKFSCDEPRSVALSFKVGTSDVEGLSPRHLGLLSMDLLHALAELLYVCELLGDYPSSLGA